METQTENKAPKLRSFSLDGDIVIGGKTIHPAGAQISIRKPQAGELRGLSMASLMNADYTALETLAPRITQPTLQKHEFAVMDPADVTQFATEVMDFLLPKAAKPDSLDR